MNRGLHGFMQPATHEKEVRRSEKACALLPVWQHSPQQVML
jgi:hypothetical protein